jgi:glycyl-tRNA synthetase
MKIEDIFTYCKKKGFVFQTSDIYGGMAGFFDYGPLGVELKNSIKQSWWQRFVKNREDVVGIDGSIISNPKVWEASGHVAGFSDLLVECTGCHARLRADHLVEDHCKIAADGMSAELINKHIIDHKIVCPKCKGTFTEPSQFNLMFSTQVGPKATHESKAYLRPETAQLIFSNFKNVADTARVKLPFGIAQIGKAFRNEISPRDFVFRCREFEQMEIEFFKKDDNCPFIDHYDLSTEVKILTAKTQDKGEDTLNTTTFDKLLKDKAMSQWHVYWLAESYDWYLSLGINPSHLRIREHMKDELSHYSSETFDIDYKFPFGWKEVHGCANRGNFDLRQHKKHSSKNLDYFDEESKTKLLPEVIEPSTGVERAFLAILVDGLHNDKERGNMVLKIKPSIAPIQVAVLPLVKNKPPVVHKAREVFNTLRNHFTCTFDAGGSVGRRYARADEIGIPFCITIDFTTIEEDNCVTVRDRDSTKQERVAIDALREFLAVKIAK